MPRKAPMEIKTGDLAKYSSSLYPPTTKAVTVAASCIPMVEYANIDPLVFFLSKLLWCTPKNRTKHLQSTCQDFFYQWNVKIFSSIFHIFIFNITFPVLKKYMLFVADHSPNRFQKPTARPIPKVSPSSPLFRKIP
jgi:hypothetical protein